MFLLLLIDEVGGCMQLSSTMKIVLLTCGLLMSSSHAFVCSARDGAGRDRSALAMNEGYRLRVSHEGITSELAVQPGETILSALERAGMGLESSADCRRGNCLTCAAQHLQDSIADDLGALPDGLSPSVSRELRDEGVVLTCSSVLRGNGVHLELGANHDVWEQVYKRRFESPQSQRIAVEAMAKVIRRTAEQNVDEWKDETEEVFRQS